MVYKIVGDFSGDNLKNMIDKLLISFKFIYIRNVLYVSVQSYKIWKERKGALQWILRNPPFDKCFVQEINETNIMREPDDAIVWCRDNLVNLDKERYQMENQDKLKAQMKALDETEAILKRQYDRVMGRGNKRGEHLLKQNRKKSSLAEQKGYKKIEIDEEFDEIDNSMNNNNINDNLNNTKTSDDVD